MTSTIQLEFFGEVPTYFGLGVEILTSVFLGGLVGLDREKKSKAAGIKTNMLICLGATLYTAVSQLMVINNGDVGGDPNRVAAQIVSGIGFLGAGAIVRGNTANSVSGLTTAATIWLVAAIGYTVGCGYPLIATLFTGTVLFVLKILSPLYGIFGFRERYHIEILSEGSVRKLISQVLEQEMDDIEDIKEIVVDEKTDRRILHLYISMQPKKLNITMSQIQEILQVIKVHSHKTSSWKIEEDF